MALYARKANIETAITEDKVEKYVAEGYTIFDENNHIVKETAPDNLNALKQAYTSHVAELKVKDAEIARLKEELARAQKTLSSMEAKAKRTESKPATADNAEDSTSPRPRRTRTKSVDVEA